MTESAKSIDMRPEELLELLQSYAREKYSEEQFHPVVKLLEIAFEAMFPQVVEDHNGRTHMIEADRKLAADAFYKVASFVRPTLKPISSESSKQGIKLEDAKEALAKSLNL